MALKKDFAWNISKTWTNTVLILLFNIFDTLGKFMAKNLSIGFRGSSLIMILRYSIEI